MAARQQQPDLAAMIATAVAEAIAGMGNPAPAPAPKGRRKGKGATSDVGRESTFRKGNLAEYQGVTGLKVGGTFTYNRSKGKGASTWKVTAINGDTVHAVKVG